MSIFATDLVLDGDGEHADDCEMYVEVSDGAFEYSGKPCSCEGWRTRPFVYKGSHILPSADDERGGSVEVAAIPNHITREGRDDGHEGLHDWLRLWVESAASQESESDYGPSGREAGDAVVLLDRPQVEALRDTLTEWLERPDETEGDFTPEQIAELQRAFDEGRVQIEER